MTQRLKVGLIGCGKQAPKHISGLTQSDQVEVVLADMHPEAARTLAETKELSWVSEPAELFADPSIVAVDICTPTPSHARLIEQAIAKGKHFFCEKPLCESLAEAEGLVRRAQERRTIGMVGYIYRCAPVFQLGRELLETVPETGSSNVLGRIVTATFRIGGRGGHQVWKHTRRAGGGAVSEMLVHMLDLVHWYFGAVETTDLLCCDLLRPQREINGQTVEVDAEDFALLRMRTAGGVNVVCQADMVTPAFTQYVEIQGTNGTFMGSLQHDMPSFVYCNRPAGRFEAGKTVLNFGKSNLFEAQMAEFIASIRENRPPRYSTVESSVELMKTLETIKERIAA